jgi:hypothetical protein
LEKTLVIRVVLGFLLAPIMPMAPFIVLNLIVNRSFQGAGPFLVVGIFYAYPAMTGAIIGTLVPLSFITPSTMALTLGAAVLVGLIGALIGAAIGFAFWQIAGRNAHLRSSGT